MLLSEKMWLIIGSVCFCFTVVPMVKAELTNLDKSWAAICLNYSFLLRSFSGFCDQLGFPPHVWVSETLGLNSRVIQALSDTYSSRLGSFYWKNVVLLRLKILKIQHLFILQQEKVQTQMSYTNNIGTCYRDTFKLELLHRNKMLLASAGKRNSVNVFLFLKTFFAY